MDNWVYVTKIQKEKDHREGFVVTKKKKNKPSRIRTNSEKKKKSNWMGFQLTKLAGSTQVVKAICEFSEGCCLTHRQRKVSLVCNYIIVWLS